MANAADNVQVPTVQMTDLRLQAVHRAIGWLRAAGADFAVKLPDGTVEGTLALAPPPPEKKKIVRVKVHDFVKELNYIETIKALAVGADMSWTLPIEKAKAFHDSLKSSATRYIGKDKYVTECDVTTGKVSILRME